MKRFGKLFAMYVLCASVISHAALVGHWTFDEAAGATTAVDAIGGSDGVINGAVITGVAGVIGNAYEFNGSGHVDMGDAAFLSGITSSSDMSYSYWLKAPVNNGTGRNVAVFLGNDRSNGGYLDSGIENGDLIYGRDRSLSSDSEIKSTDTYNDNTWHHVVYVIDADTGHKLYIDGSLAASDTAALKLPTDLINNFEIGRLGRLNATDYFHGAIDDVRVYDEALTLGQVQALFEPKLASNPIPPIGSINIPINQILAWDAPNDPNVASTLGYNVYLDPNETDVTNGLGAVLVSSNQSETSYDSVDFMTDTTYYWRVDAVNQLNDANSTVETLPGYIWSFTTVPAAPQITLQPLTTRGYPTDAGIALTCEFTSASAATVQWYKDGQTLSTAGDVVIDTTNNETAYTTTLQILTPEVADEGEYYCVINNGDELMSDSAWVIINKLLVQYDFDGSLIPAVGSVVDAPVGQGKTVEGVPDANSWQASDVTLSYVTGVNGTGQAINLNPGQYIDFGIIGYPRASNYANGIGDGLDAGTIVCWVKPLNTGVDEAILVNYNPTPDPTGFGLTLLPGGATARGRIYVRAKTETGNPIDLAPALLGLSDRPGWDIYDGDWHLLAATWQAGDVANLYLDGQLVATESTNSPAFYEPWQQGVLIGAGRGGTYRQLLNGMLAGAVDNLRVYNYRLDTDSNEVFAEEYYDNTGVLPCMDIHFVGNEFNIDNTGSSYCKVDLADMAIFAGAWLSNGLWDAP
jgi:hypothetical protein